MLAGLARRPCGDADLEKIATSSEASGNRTPPAPPAGPAPRQQPRKPLRPGVALAWAGLALGIVGLVVMHVRVGGRGAGWVLLGVYGYFADMGLIVVGFSLAVLGVVLSIWGLIVTIRWRSGVHALCATGLAISLGAVILGNHQWTDYLPKYQMAEWMVQMMKEQEKELETELEMMNDQQEETPSPPTAPATEPAPSP
jgi:hypothetical protein